MKIKWTELDIAFLRENFGAIPTKDIIAKLGRTNRSVWHKIRELKLVQKTLSIGDRFNRLTISKIIIVNKYGQNHTFVWCDCICGKQTYQRMSNVKSGQVKSCGCLKNEKASERASKLSVKHNLTTHPLFSVWVGMKSRCNYPSSLAYKNYGGRGIKICDEWKNFQTFYDWSIENGWQINLELDRINNNGNYEPNNCRYVTASVNSNNKRNNVKITAFGQTKTLTEWTRSPECKTTAYSIRYRMKAGWDAEQAISTPTLDKTRFMGKNQKRDLLTINGKTMTIAEWAREPECEICYQTLFYRVKKNWPQDIILRQF